MPDIPNSTISRTSNKHSLKQHYNITKSQHKRTTYQHLRQQLYILISTEVLQLVQVEDSENISIKQSAVEWCAIVSWVEAGAQSLRESERTGAEEQGCEGELVYCRWSYLAVGYLPVIYLVVEHRRVVS